MGIYGALSSAVTGLRAQAHALENISGNIANSQTTGYKRIETDFLDLIPDAPISRQVPGAVLAQSRGTNDIGGDIKTVSNETFIALNSNGFFVVEPKIGQSDGNPVFAGSNFYTRRGDFEIDKDGMLVNGAGYYLKGLLIDPGTGNISGSVPAPIKLSNSFLEARQSSRINYQANLPQVPKTTAADKNVFNSELMQSRNYTGAVWNPASVTGTTALNAVPVTASVEGTKVFNGATGLASAVLNGSSSLTLQAGAASRTIDFVTTSTITGAQSFVGPTVVGAGVFTDTTVLNFTAGGVTRAITFDSTAPATATNIHTAGMNMDDILTAVQAGVRSGAAGPLSNATVALNGNPGQLKVTLGTNQTDTLSLGGNGLGIFNIAAAPSATTVHVTPTMTMNQAMAAIQAGVRSGPAGELSTANVKIATGGQMSLDLGTNTTDGLQISGGGTTLADLGLLAATTPPGSSSAAVNYFTPGQSITLKINGTATTFEFNTTVPYTGANRPVDVSGTVAQAAANLQAAIRANGGPSAAAALVTITPGNQLKISLGNNQYANFSVEEGEASLGIATNAAVSAASGSRVDSVSADQNALFLSNSIQGTAITVYAKNGAPADVSMRWAKVSSDQAGGTETWNLFYQSNSLATGGAEMWKRVPEDFTFSGGGALESPTEASVMFDDLSVNGVSVGDIEFRFETNGLTQFADVNGTASVSKLSQNGYGAGQFVSVAINDDGRVTTTYSNGERIDMAQVVTADFNAINKLKRLDGGVFSATSESGEAIVDLSGSGIMGGALEASNTDISDEFTKLIVTQQAYAAGTRIVSAADKMLQEALNMIR